MTPKFHIGDKVFRLGGEREFWYAILDVTGDAYTMQYQNHQYRGKIWHNQEFDGVDPYYELALDGLERILEKL